jgi:hypothetical protein
MGCHLLAHPGCPRLLDTSKANHSAGANLSFLSIHLMVRVLQGISWSPASIKWTRRSRGSHHTSRQGWRSSTSIRQHNTRSYHLSSRASRRGAELSGGEINSPCRPPPCLQPSASAVTMPRNHVPPETRQRASGQH